MNTFSKTTLMVIVILFGNCFITQAQNNDAKNILIKAYDNIKGSVTNPTEMQIAINYYSNDNSSATIFNGTLLQAGNYFRFTSDQLLGAFDGKNLNYYKKDDNTFTLSTPTREEVISFNPLIALNRSINNFNIDGLYPTKGGKSIELSPKNTKGQIKKVSIGFYNGDNRPQNVTITLKDGSRLTAKLFGFKKVTNSAGQSTFKFSSKSYPKAEIIDLR